MKREMKLKYAIFALLTLFSVLCFVPAGAQVKHKAKKQVRKTAHKTAAKRHKAPVKVLHKPIAKPIAKPVAVQKSEAKSLGEGAAKVKIDTTKKANLPGNSLSE